MSSDATPCPEGDSPPDSAFDIPTDAAGIEGLAAAGIAPAGEPLPTTHHASPASHPGRLPLGTGQVLSANLGAITLENGATISVTMAYRHDGPGPDAPQIMVIHALTGSADAAGDWWEPVIGPGRALDTDRFGVLCANLLGGRYGSTGPLSVDPATGAPYGAAFPQPTPRDEAVALWALADHLGIERFVLVAGGSLGGMVAQEVALARPLAVGHLAVLGAPAVMGAMALAWNHIQLELLDALGERGLALARQLAMTTYRSEADFDGRFGRQLEADGRFSVASYLDYQGGKILGRFDPDTYRTLVRVMDGHDVGRARGGIGVAFSVLEGTGTGVTGIGIEGDILFGPAQVRALVDAAASVGVDAVYRELASSKGHDAFLIEWDQLTGFLAEALADGLARSGY